jgi:tRNA (guanosine-2'-O-)-methyltransferase
MTEQEKKIYYQRAVENMNDRKKELLDKILAHRTRHITVAVEDVYLSQNANAIIRSCEIFGVQDIHLVEERNRFVITKGVSMGAAKWMTLSRYPAMGSCVDALHEQGYVVYATTPQADAVSLYDMPVDKKIALLFGAERRGLSDEGLARADSFVTIPMYGFTQSFNVSVSVALCLQFLMGKIRTLPKSVWQLTDDEKAAIKNTWLARILDLEAWVDTE